MCHLILLLPVVALSLFWFFPVSIAGPAYGVVLIVSGWVYFLAIRAMRRPVQTGVEALMHSIGEVLGKEGSLFRVRVRSEVWNAESKDNLQPGDAVEVVSVDELRLEVRRISGPLTGNTFRNKDANGTWSMRRRWGDGCALNATCNGREMNSLARMYRRCCSGKGFSAYDP